jgi:hypothetical protein
MITPDEFKKLMERTRNLYFDDTVGRHVQMDALMAATLSQLGYGDGVMIFNHTPKGYREGV